MEGRENLEALGERAHEPVRAALEAAGIAAVLCDGRGEILAFTSPAQALVGDVAHARSEGELLLRLAGLSSEPLTADQLRKQAEAGGTRISLLENGGIGVEIVPLPGGLKLWLLRSGEDGDGARKRQELLGIASHDLRSPLANVRSYAGMILGGKGPPLDPRVQRAAQVIAKNAERGLRLVDDYVDLRRADESQLELYPSNVPLEEVLRLAFEEVRPAAVDKGVRMTLAVPDGLPVIRADEDKLRRLVRAMLEAAVRRTPTEGEVRLTAEARSTEIFVSVEDEGERPSLREAALAFDRDHQTLKERKLAAGVSLALAQAVARAHGGRVGAVPRGDVGAIHYLVLPRQGAA